MTDQEPNETSAREKKRAQFTDERKSGMKSAPIWIVAVLVLGGAVAYFALSGPGDAPAVVAEAPRPESAQPSGELRVPASDVSGGRAKFFDYKLANNQPIRFFVVKSSEGDYRAALDACEVCAHSKQGYKQEGDDMVCRNCNKRFATALIGKIQGGCHPISLTLTTDGSDFVIKKSELEAGARYF
jgi:uncharacterized membrane protein